MNRNAIGFAALLCAATVCSGSARAADLPVKAPPNVAVASVYNWTGFYIGGHGGFGWGRKEWTDLAGPPFDAGSHRVDGAVAGGQVGFNYQTGPWVLGVEGQFSWANLDGNHLNPLDLADSLTTRVRWMSSVAARIGYAFERTLVYVKGGGAWARDHHETIDLGVLERTGGATRSGWLVGGGLEYGIGGGWSAKVEYNFMDFGRRTITMSPVDPAGDADLFDIDQHIHTVIFGLNYRFGGGPVVARY
jgi:outer membrane immunogenic protein